jgi:hypothetical protein
LGRIDIYIFNFTIIEVITAGYKEPFEQAIEKGSQKGTIMNFAVCPS